MARHRRRTRRLGALLIGVAEVWLGSVVLGISIHDQATGWRAIALTFAGVWISTRGVMDIARECGLV